MNWIIYFCVTVSSIVVPGVTSWSNEYDYGNHDSQTQMIRSLHQRVRHLEALLLSNFVGNKPDAFERELHQMKEENTHLKINLRSQEDKFNHLQRDHLALQNTVNELLKHMSECKGKDVTSSMPNMVESKSEPSAAQVLKPTVVYDLENEKDDDTVANARDKMSNRNLSLGVSGNITTSSRHVLEKPRQIFLGQVPQRQVSFHATLSVLVLNYLAVGQAIIFDQVVSNIGDGYHVRSGMFIAPEEGIYVFHVSVMSAPGKHQDLRLVKEGTVVQHVYADARSSSGYHSGSITVPMHVNKGGEVWVQAECCNDATIHGNTYTIFTGWLTS
ncbi:hypothetical protein CHS0354_002634 [Potamilus streckersoni]|uniref:C1q domain-containing protein n=1 Tax=Potamilus streckersoni TaxID=2493646 RepID=A0AAE0VHF8_9BIVA|nr:hypothetical protein CHS0354_002634 [Potamilus streckersoni]